MPRPLGERSPPHRASVGEWADIRSTVSTSGGRRKSMMPQDPHTPE